MRPQPLWARCALRALDALEAAPVRALPWGVFAAALVLCGIVDASSRAGTVLVGAAALALRLLLGGSARDARERAAALVGLVGGAAYYAGEVGPFLRGPASGAASALAEALAALRPAQPPPAAEDLRAALPAPSQRR